MLNRIRENRVQRDGLYQITLQMPENEYFDVYEGLSDDAAAEILGNYLSYHQDDARPDDIHISHNKNAHVVNIDAKLHYTGNEHTDSVRVTPDTLNRTRGI